MIPIADECSILYPDPSLTLRMTEREDAIGVHLKGSARPEYIEGTGERGGE
jgi:hypothetical protein